MEYLLKNIKLYITLIIAGFFIQITAMSSTNNTYKRMNYKEIFNQKNILSKCPRILEKEGHETCKFAPEEPTIKTKLKNIINILICGCFQKYKNTKIQKKLIKYNNKLDKSPETENKTTTQENNEDDCIDDCIVEIDQIDIDSEETKILNKALATDYQTKRTWAMKRALVEPLALSVLSVTAAILCCCLVPGDTGKSIGGNVLVHTLKSNIKKFGKASYSIFISPIADPLEKYEKIYAKRKRFLDRELQETIEEQLNIARKNNLAIPAVTQFIRIALNLPLKSKLLAPLTHCKYKEEVDDLLCGYDDEIAEIIKRNFFNHYKRYSSKARPSETPKTVLNFQGPTGIGKTYITEKIAHFMGATLIKLTPIETPQSIIGTEQTPGSFLESICKPDIPRNAIITIDAVDLIVNKNNLSLQLFSPFLKPNAKYFYSPYLKANIDISHFCFVLCGNNEIENETLQSHPTTIQFKTIKKKKKKDIIYTMISEKVKDNIELMLEIDDLIDDLEDMHKLQKTVTEKVNQFLMGIQDPQKRHSTEQTDQKLCASQQEIGEQTQDQDPDKKKSE